MNKIYLKGMVCASALATAAFAAVAQDVQPPPHAPAVVGTTARLTSDASSSVIVKVDGSRVIDVVGQPLGRIENIVLSPVGCAEAAILTAANGRLIPIPWTLVRVSGDTRAAGAMPGANLVFTVNVEQARLAQAPSFTRSQFPDMSNQNWMQASINFFGAGQASAVGATGGGTNVVTGAGAQSRIGATATGGTNQSRFGTTATGGTNQNRIGTTATGVPPAGQPDPNRPDFNQPGNQQPPPGVPPGPPENRPPDNRPPDNRPPPGTPPGAQQPPGSPPGSVPPARPSTQP